VLLTFGTASDAFSQAGTVRPAQGAEPKTASEREESVRQRSWGQWRGPLSNGVAPFGNPPIAWSEKKNVRWKTPIPGLAHASPVVWGDRVFVTTAIPFGDKVEPVPDDAPGAHDNAPVDRHQDFAVLAIDRRTGAVLWQRSLFKGLPPAGAHNSASLASGSPITDGESLFAYFGSLGIYCLDMTGKLRWKQDFGDMSVKHGHGEGASPVLHGNTLVVNWDHEGQSFLVAMDKRTGARRWRVERSEVTSWSTPIVVTHAGKQQLIVAGTSRVRSHDFKTGELIWECRGLSNNIVASPVAADGIVIIGSSYVRRAMLAIRLEGASGDITDTDRVVWRRTRGTPYVPSPLLHGRWVYFLNHYQGVLSRIDAKTGKEPLGPFRVPGAFNIYASPVAAKDRLYVTDREGMTVVMSHTDGVPKILAQNQLDDGFSASAAIVGEDLFLRGHHFLYCLARPEKRSRQGK
jgi:outer membrane protein assembly factor BamB